MENHFYSNGKLLLSGEYAILDGAVGLAIPTRYGQNLEIRLSDTSKICWESYDHDNRMWYSEDFYLPNLQPSSPENPITQRLLQIFKEAQKLNLTFLKDNIGFDIRTTQDFPRNWGLGTSSTLINNIAQWAQVDPFELLSQTFGGSGYDIAAAQNDSPIFFSKKQELCVVEPVRLDWNFSDKLFFVYLNKKKDSREAIAHYRESKLNARDLLKISDITLALPACQSLSHFEMLLQEHEEIMSSILKTPTIKEGSLIFDRMGILE